MIFMRSTGKQKRCRRICGFFYAVVIAATMFAVMPQMVTSVHAEAGGGTLLSGDALNGAKVRIRPTGSHKPLSINQDGEGNQNCVHLYYQGKSSQFYLEKADADSYYIYFYKHYRDADPKKSGDCRLDLEDDGGYGKEGQVIHVVSGNATAMNKRWQFIRQADGTYYVRNKKTQKYWSLNDLSKPKTNNNKLVQRSNPLNWDMEIVSYDSNKLKTIIGYDSRNFTYNGHTVTSTNWMGALPGDLKITDISIPGTHDAGSCNLHSDQDDMSTQRYYIDELLNCGVRHLDMRTDLNGDTVRIVHSTSHARNHSNKELTLNETMSWIYSFLAANPTETVIFQVKMDKGGDECERETFRLLEAMAKETDSRIWAGDHVPTLDEVRGKIVIISRLDTSKLMGGNFNIVKDGKILQWGLDCYAWKVSNDKASALTSQGSNYEVWTQDDWSHGDDDKKPYIKATLFGNKNDGYTNGTLYRYDRAKAVGKDAWIFNYTSSSKKPRQNPFDIAKEVHQWLYDRSDYSSSDRLVCKDTFTGVMAFDYMDGLMATKIYKTNFNRQYITIHGITAEDDEPLAPLVLSVGDESETTDKLLSNITAQMIRAHFNTEPYRVMTSDNGGILSESQVKNLDDFNSVTASFREAAGRGHVSSDLYVHLELPVRNAEYDVTMPECNTEVTAADPKVTVSVGDDVPYEPVEAFITESETSSVPLDGPVYGGEANILVYLAPKWGYRMQNACSVISGTTEIIGSALKQNGRLEIGAKGLIPHRTDTPMPQVEPTCEQDGTKEHYHCNGCGKDFIVIEGLEGMVQVKAGPGDLVLSALGHDWGEWTETRPATESDDGEMRRTCSRDGCMGSESLVIPKSTHEHTEHTLSHFEAREAENCIQTGNKEYWKCNECNSFFYDADGQNQISESDIKTVGPHDWGDPEYTVTKDGSKVTVTACRTCVNKPSHLEKETVPATIEYKAPNCEEGGYEIIRAKFVNPAFAYEIKTDIDPLGHESVEGREVVKPTCSSCGEKLLTCERCGATGTKEIPEDPDAHVIYTEDDDNNTATCTEPGRQTQREVCSICGKVLSTKSVNTEPRGHVWSEPSYTWSDDNSKVTATRYCKREGCNETQSETSKASSRVLAERSCKTDGLVRYVADFGNEFFDTQEKTAETKASGHDYHTQKITKATLTRDGRIVKKCSVCNTETTVRIYCPKKFILSATSYIYDGKVKKPKVTVTDSNKGVIPAADYKVTYESGRKNVGTYKVTIKMKGNYSGTRTLSFKINPKGTTVSKVTKAKKAAVVKWNKQSAKMSSARITGYQIQLATDSKFTKNKKSVKVKGYSKTSWKVTGLKGGKKYYVRIRTYRTIGKTTYYSPWSKVKTVTTGK